MNAINYHLQMWNTGTFAPIVWILVARAIMLLLISGWMFQEPMLCGGRNSPLHRALGIYFFINAINVFNRAFARMDAIVNSPGPIAVDSLIITESIFLIATVLLLLKMAYDYYLYHTARKLNIEHRCGRECQKPVVDERSHNGKNLSISIDPRGEPVRRGNDGVYR